MSHFESLGKADRGRKPISLRRSSQIRTTVTDVETTAVIDNSKMPTMLHFPIISPVSPIRMAPQETKCSNAQFSEQIKIETVPAALVCRKDNRDLLGSMSESFALWPRSVASTGGFDRSVRLTH
jgi:hypothetical protein